VPLPRTMSRRPVRVPGRAVAAMGRPSLRAELCGGSGRPRPSCEGSGRRVCCRRGCRRLSAENSINAIGKMFFEASPAQPRVRLIAESGAAQGFSSTAASHYGAGRSFGRPVTPRARGGGMAATHRTRAEKSFATTFTSTFSLFERRLMRVSSGSIFLEQNRHDDWLDGANVVDQSFAVIGQRAGPRLKSSFRSQK